jgi:hypothetical protein
MKRVLLALLFLNVLALGLGMFLRDAPWIEYLNLYGCVLFGYVLAEK